MRASSSTSSILMRASYGRCKEKCDTCWRRAIHVRRSCRVDSRARSKTPVPGSPTSRHQRKARQHQNSDEVQEGRTRTIRLHENRNATFGCMSCGPAMREFTALWNWQDAKRCHRGAVRRDKGGDLSAVFSCSDNIARVSSRIALDTGTPPAVWPARPPLVHRFQDIRDTAKLLAELNDAFTLSNEKSASPLRLTTVVTEPLTAQAANLILLTRRTRGCSLARARKRFLELGKGWRLPLDTLLVKSTASRACG